MQHTLRKQGFQTQKLPEMKKTTNPVGRPAGGRLNYEQVSFPIYFGSDAIQVWGPCFP